MSANWPSVRRSASAGMSARFSAQSVSITPSAGCSTASTKPVSAQNLRATLHACSGVTLTTSHRSLPARATRALGTVARNSASRDLPLACWAASPLAVDTEKRSS